MWHRHLVTISKYGIKKLVMNGILENLYFTDFGICVDYIRRKQTKQNKIGVTRSKELLELIHIDLYNATDFMF